MSVGGSMSRMINWGVATIALICCAAGQAAPSARSTSPTPAKSVVRSVDSVLSKPVEVNVVSLPAQTPTITQSSAPFVIHVDKWPARETDWSAWAVALFTLVLAVATFLLWRSTEALANEARNTARRQLRAYVFPVQLEKAAGTSTEVTVAVKNFGSTPAYGLASAARAELTVSEDYLTPIDDAGHSLGILAPGSITEVKCREQIAIPNGPLADLDTAKTELYVHGLIAYTDTFGQKHWSRFRQVYRDGRFVACRSGNDADDAADLS